MSEYTPTVVKKPYVGPNPIENKDSFFGRDRETAELIIRLKANHHVLLYSPSGAGKTSLIKAGLIPSLEGQEYCVLPTIRLNRLAEPGKLAPDTSHNRYLLSALISLDQGLDEANHSAAELLAAANLADYLKSHLGAFAQHSGNPAARRFLLIFDQFEEILTIDPTDKAAKEFFFGELLNILNDNRYWAVFAMREDYLARLEPYLSYFPERLSAHFRLEFLEPAEALQAVQNPVKEFGVSFMDDAAKQLVADLRQVYTLTPQGVIEKQPGPFVEPVQLQVVCSNLWEAPRPDPSQITLEDVRNWGNVDDALANYYQERIKETAQSLGIPERSLREWIGNKLITSQGLRNQVLSGHDPEYGITEGVIEKLVNAYLVREDQRRGATWLELAHDRLVEPIRRNNAGWFEGNLSLLQRQAILWERAGRPDHLLLRDKALEEGEAWAATGVALTRVESALLDESRELYQRMQKDRQAEIKLQAAERQRKLAIVATGFAALAIVLMFVAGYLWRDALNTNVKLQNANATAFAATDTRIAELGLAPVRDTAIAATLQSNLTATAQYAGVTQQAQATRQGEIAEVATSIAQTSLPPTLLPGAPTLIATQGVDPGYFVQPFLAASEKLKSNQPDLALLLAAIAYSASEDKAATGETLQAMVNDLSRTYRPLGNKFAGMGSPILGLTALGTGRNLAVSAASGDITLFDENGKALGSIKGVPESSKNTFLGPQGEVLALVGPAAEGVSIYWSEFDTVDWNKLFPAGIRFAALRVTPTILERTNMTGDSNRFPASWNNLLSVDPQDFIRGAYWEFNPQEDPVTQVELFYNLITNQSRLINGYGEVGDMPLILQINQTGGSGGGDLAARIKAALDWLEEKTGRKPVIYTSPDFWNASLLDAQGNAPEWTADYPLWVRDVNSKAQPVLPTGWSTWAFWDYATCAPKKCTLPSIGDQTTYYQTRFNGALGQLEDFAQKPMTNLALRDNYVYIWDVAAAQPLRRISLIPEYITSLAGSLDGSLLVTGRHGGTLDAWSFTGLLRSGGPQDIAAGPDHDIGDLQNPAKTLALGPGNRWLFSTNSEDVAWLWDVPSQNYIGIKLWCGRSERFTAPAFDPSGRWLSAVDGSNATCLWDISQIPAQADFLEAEYRLEGHTQPVTAVAFNGDGSYLASGASDGILIYTLAELNQRPKVLPAPPGGVTSLVFGPEAGLLAAGSQDGTIFLWKDWLANDAAQPLYGQTGKIDRLAFTPSSLALYSGGEAGEVYAWDLSLETPDAQACALAGRNPGAEELASFGMKQAQIQEYQDFCSTWLASLTRP